MLGWSVCLVGVGVGVSVMIETVHMVPVEQHLNLEPSRQGL